MKTKTWSECFSNKIHFYRPKTKNPASVTLPWDKMVNLKETKKVWRLQMWLHDQWPISPAHASTIDRLTLTFSFCETWNKWGIVWEGTIIDIAAMNATHNVI